MHPASVRVISCCKQAGRWEAAGAVAAGRDAGGGVTWPDSLSFNFAISQARKAEALEVRDSADN